MDMFCLCIPSWNHFPHFHNSSGQTDPESAVRETDPESAVGQTDLETAVGQTDINPSDPSRNNKNETIDPDITIKEESINVYNAINDVSDIKELSTTIEEKTPVLGSQRCFFHRNLQI
jgi:hypothetical protein